MSILRLTPPLVDRQVEEDVMLASCIATRCGVSVRCGVAHHASWSEINLTNEVLAAQSWHRMNWQVGLGCLIGQLLTSVLDCSCFGYVPGPPSPTLPASSPRVAGGRRAAVLRNVLFRLGSRFCVFLVKRQRAATGNGSCLFIAVLAAGARGRLLVAARKTYLTQHVSYTP